MVRFLARFVLSSSSDDSLFLSSSSIFSVILSLKAPKVLECFSAEAYPFEALVKDLTSSDFVVDYALGVISMFLLDLVNPLLTRLFDLSFYGVAYVATIYFWFGTVALLLPNIDYLYDLG